MSDPRSGGLLHALGLLLGPTRFEAVAPTHAGLRYDDTPRRGIAPLCDVYLPDGAGPHPSVVVVHGGAFVVGSRDMKPVRLVATRLLQAGFAVCAVDYRLLLRGGGLDVQVEDVNRAAAYWRAACARFGCDPDRISMLGFSAGAALMLLHAGRSAHAYHKLVSIYGVTSFDRIRGRRAALVLRWILGTSDRRAWEERSPLAHATARSPLLVIHGTDDDLVPVHHATRLHQSRVARGLVTELELVEGMRHGWLNDASLPETERAIARVLAFLRE